MRERAARARESVAAQTAAEVAGAAEQEAKDDSGSDIDEDIAAEVHNTLALIPKQVCF